MGMKFFHFSGVSSRAKIASTGHAGTQAPQSMHSSGWMYSISTVANSGSSLRGWIQSTGQTSTHALSLVPIHGSVMMYATDAPSLNQVLSPRRPWQVAQAHGNQSSELHGGHGLLAGKRPLGGSVLEHADAR